MATLLTPQARAANTFVNTGSLNIGRELHTATLLQNGKVLVCGGTATSGPPDRAELYDPITSAWEDAGTIGGQRFAHTATLLPNGKVLVAGGYGDLAGAKLYNPFFNWWEGTGSMNFTHAFHTATLLANGKVLVTGGEGTGGAVAELYNPDTGTWEVTGLLSESRVDHTATLLTNGKVLVTGGSNNSGYLSSAELFNPATGSWTVTNPMLTRRRYHTATLLPNGKVLVAAGTNQTFFDVLSSAEIFDPTTESWTATGGLNMGRVLHSASLLPNGKVLIAGGFYAGDLRSSELYDPTVGTWTTAGDLGVARNRLRSTLLNSGKLLITGGYNNALSNHYIAISELFYTVSPLESFRTSNNLASDGSQDLLTPAGDGVPNILKYAFNMKGSGPGQAASLSIPNVASLEPEGFAGLPAPHLEIDNVCAFSYIRLKASAYPGVSYTMEFSYDLSVDSWWTDGATTETITNLDETIERVTLKDYSGSSRLFARVRVSVLP